MHQGTCFKFRYLDKKSALSAINERTKGRKNNRHNRPKPGSLRAYFCPDCRYWHLTQDKEKQNYSRSR